MTRQMTITIAKAERLQTQQM